MAQPRLKHFGWGREGEGITPEEEAFVWARIKERFRIDEFAEVKPPRLDEIELHPPRVKPPASLAPIASTERYDRAAHTYGKSYPDYVRGLLGDYAAAPDIVVYPRNERDVAAVLDWAEAAQASVTPFGGGSSVVGGVEPRIDGLGRYQAAVTLDLRDMHRVIEVDRTCRPARISAPAARCGSPASSLRRARCARSRKPGFIPRTAASSIRRRPTTPAPATAQRPSWCWRSNPPTIRSRPGWRARSNAAATMRASSSRRAPRTRIGKAPPGAGATPSSACPTRASARSSAASSTIRSRPRSPGSASRRSTTASRRRPSG